MADPIIIKIPSPHDRIVALKSVADPTVIAHGRTRQAVARKAKKAGYDNPIFMFVPKPGATCIF